MMEAFLGHTERKVYTLKEVSKAINNVQMEKDMFKSEEDQPAAREKWNTFEEIHQTNHQDIKHFKYKRNQSVPSNMTMQISLLCAGCVGGTYHQT